MACPLDGNALRWDRAGGRLLDGHHEYPIRLGIPVSVCAEAADWLRTSTMLPRSSKNFTRKHHFPTMTGLDTRDSLRQKATAGILARMLDAQLPRRCKILEAGCGTGQMTNFLAMHQGRTVVGSDICFNSLKSGQPVPQTVLDQQRLFRPDKSIQSLFQGTQFRCRRIQWRAAPHRRCGGGFPFHPTTGEARRLCGDRAYIIGLVDCPRFGSAH